MKRLAALALLFWAVACGTSDGAVAPGGLPPSTDPAAKPPEQTGSLSFALTLQEGVELDAFRYAITGPSFTRPGEIDVSDSRTVSALIPGIPAGTGYSITLTGGSKITRPNGATVEATCSGSAAFDVTAGTVTSVPVAIACRVDEKAPPNPNPGPNPVPLPPLAPIALGSLLLAIGTLLARRRKS